MLSQEYSCDEYEFTTIVWDRDRHSAPGGLGWSLIGWTVMGDYQTQTALFARKKQNKEPYR